MEKSKINGTIRLSKQINEMDKETFLLLCRKLNDQRKSEMEYEVFLNHAYNKLRHEITENKISLEEIELHLNMIISNAYKIGNEADIFYRIDGYVDNVKRRIKEENDND